MVPIYEATLISATNTDVLSVGRLVSIPYNGKLTLRFLADLSDVTNFYTLTLQLPGGDVPIDAQRVRGSGAGTDGLMDERELLQVTYAAQLGGHFTVSLTESGTATCMFEAILRP